MNILQKFVSATAFLLFFCATFANAHDAPVFIKHNQFVGADSLCEKIKNTKEKVFTGTLNHLYFTDGRHGVAHIKYQARLNPAINQEGEHVYRFNVDKIVVLNKEDVRLPVGVNADDVEAIFSRVADFPFCERNA